jgi:hypothetical protein
MFKIGTIIKLSGLSLEDSLGIIYDFKVATVNTSTPYEINLYYIYWLVNNTFSAKVQPESMLEKLNG